MHYIIDTWLEDGAPCLDIRDADTGAVRLHWSYGQLHHTAAQDQGARMALKDLFKKLMLLSCADKISMVGRANSAAFGTECLDCGQCVSSQQSVPVVDNVVYLRDCYTPGKDVHVP